MFNKSQSIPFVTCSLWSRLTISGWCSPGTRDQIDICYNPSRHNNDHSYTLCLCVDCFNNFIKSIVSCILVTIISWWYAQINKDPVFLIMWHHCVSNDSNECSNVLGSPQMTRQDTWHQETNFLEVKSIKIIMKIWPLIDSKILQFSKLCSH